MHLVAKLSLGGDAVVVQMNQRSAQNTFGPICCLL
jgi:hypothetical protein